MVTAQKRAQSVQDIPATVAAFSQETLETRQIRGLADLTTQVPSLQVGTTFGSNLITLRGISTNLTSGFEDASIAVHVNGVYQSRARSLNLALMDLERIEVLSGPQGTLYGRNATGGVINYILRRPTKEMEAEVTGRVGNFDSYTLQGFISGPISDKVGFRVAGLWDNRDKGFVKNLLPGAPKSSFGESKVAGVRGVLSFEPSDDLTIDLEGSFAHTRGSFIDTALDPATGAFFGPLVAGRQSFRPRTVLSDVDARMDTKQYATSATVTWDLSDDIQLKSISAYQKYKNFMDAEGDFSSAALQEALSSNRSRTYSQELNLNVSSIDGRLKSVFGIFYFNDKVTQRTDVVSGAFTPDGSIIRIYRADMQQKAKSVAFFTDNIFSVTDKLRVIAGLRYNIDKKSVYWTILPTCNNLRRNRKDTAWTPRAGLQFDITDKIMAYATYQKGYKAGGFASGACDNAYDPESIEGGEAGIKTTFADNRIRLNLAGYWYDYGNLQVQRTLPSVGGFSVQNAAESRIKGVEGNLDARITDALSLDMSAMAQSAKYSNYTNCNQRPGPTNCASGAPLEQLKGNWLNRAAPWSVNVGLQYEVPVGNGKLLLRGESFWSGKIRYDEFNTAALTQRAYNLQNAFLTFTPDGDQFTLRAFVKNIRNVNTRASGAYSASLGQDQTIWNLPRTYGAEATYRF
ncbi:TonB-dependent receptor [Sphingobium sp. AN558]|uniref:TonB-dependent receptor n=1 Tax=Sphingobium sp. AN558 TaxID=3133442 RepID=UPI0030C05EF5